MITFPSYWTTQEFTEGISGLGYVEEPIQKTFDPTMCWQQIRTFSGPMVQFKQFWVLLTGDHGHKPFQASLQPDGPNIRTSVVFYSNDYDGLQVRDPLLTTWGMTCNRGNEPIVSCRKATWAFRNCPDVIRKVQVAVALWQNVLSPMTNTFWKSLEGTQPYTITQLQNQIFAAVVCLKAGGSTDLETYTAKDGSVYTPTVEDLWHAAQMFRMLCKGVTSFPTYQYVLHKTSICFPNIAVEGVSLGSDMRASYDRVGYAFSTVALRERETLLTSDIASLLDVDRFPRFWWVKQPPIIEQTSDGRWNVRQEWWGYEWFEPWIYPWVTGEGEVIVDPVFDPSKYYDSPRENDPIPASKTLYGVKDGTCVQWPKELQDAIYGNQDGTTDID
jgi:hypothetical protein